LYWDRELGGSVSFESEGKGSPSGKGGKGGKKGKDGKGGKKGKGGKGGKKGKGGKGKAGSMAKSLKKKLPKVSKSKLSKSKGKGTKMIDR
jgi:hypothetical protein